MTWRLLMRSNMKARNHLVSTCFGALAWLLASSCTTSSALAEEGRKEDTPGRVEVARGLSATGTLVRREGPEKPWQMVKEGAALYSGDLIIGLPGAALESK